MPCRTTQGRWIVVKSSDKMWSTEGENGKSIQYSCYENPMNSMKRQKDMTLEDEPPGQKVSSMLLGKNRGQLLIAPEAMKWLRQSGKDAQCLVVKIKSDTVKNSIA